MTVVHAPAGAPAGTCLHPALADRPLGDELWRRDAPDDHWVVERQGVAVPGQGVAPDAALTLRVRGGWRAVLHRR